MDYLYIVYNRKTKLTKIGITENLERRISQIENGIGGGVEFIAWSKFKSAEKTEKFLHSIFQEKRKSGEWFNLDKNEIDYLIDVWEGIFDPLLKDEGKLKNITYDELPIQTIAGLSFVYCNNPLKKD